MSRQGIAGILLMLFMLVVNSYAKETDIAVQIGGDFTLTDHHGKLFRLHDHRGKVIVIFFGYTYCPDVCPTELSMLARVLQSLDKGAAGNNPESKKIMALFISIDPERDSTEKLKQYVSFYSPHLIGLTGSQEEIDKVADAYHVQRKIHAHQPSNKNYLVDHSANLYVVNTQGELDTIIPFGLPLEHIRQVVAATR